MLTSKYPFACFNTFFYDELFVVAPFFTLAILSPPSFHFKEHSLNDFDLLLLKLDPFLFLRFALVGL